MNKKKIALIIIGILLILAAAATILILKFGKKEDEGPKNTASVVDRIDGYDYTVDDRDTELFKNEFKELKAILTADELDYKKYAECLAKLFVIDFYTLDNKINKYDVGSLEYVQKDIVDNFKLKAQETMYKYLEDDSDHRRVQDLPIVKSILESTSEEVKWEEKDAYKVVISWEYEKDLGYDSVATIVFLKEEKLVTLVEYEPSKNQEGN